MIYSTDADQNTTHLITGKNVAVDNRKTGLSIIHGFTFIGIVKFEFIHKPKSIFGSKPYST